MTTDAERLSPDAVRWLNRELAKSDLRVCELCQGHALPLDTEHFYQRETGRFRYVCIPCYCARVTERWEAKYYNDADWRRAELNRTNALRKADPESDRANSRRYRRRRKARRFAQVLAEVQP